jgi:hypothetical protein
MAIMPLRTINPLNYRSAEIKHSNNAFQAFSDDDFKAAKPDCDCSMDLFVDSLPLLYRPTTAGRSSV